MDYEAARQKLLDRLADGVIDDEEFHKRMAAIDRAEAADRARRQASAISSTLSAEYEPDREGATTPLVIGPGFSLGKYVLREPLGAGGMGFVWVAYDQVGEREVALKILPQALQQQPAELQRFRKTFQLVERLHHSHVCPLYELAHFPHPGIGWYQVMRLIRGRTLQEFCDDYRAQRGNLPVDMVVELFEPIARALDDAHARKIVHRDIKPENILVEGEGLAIDHVWLIDFGIAAEIRSTMTRASTSETVETAGSRGYLAPELYQARYPNAFSDQYALAVVAYELLAGQFPFLSDDFLVLRQAVLEQPVPAIDGVAESVQAALRKALAKQPGERFPNCREFVQQLAKPGETAKPIVSAVPPVPKLRPDKIVPGTKAGEVRTFTDLGIKFCWCPAGEFLMGSPASDSKADNYERPQYRVRLTEGFWLGQTEVTQEQWERVMGSNPSKYMGRQNPVEQVSWEEAVAYCRKLTNTERDLGRLPSDWSYRLPTEAEWEYASRAGTTTRYGFGESEAQLGESAWFAENSGGATHPVGAKKPNAWGLYDLHGNVWEWCEDWYGKYAAGEVTDPHGPSEGSSRVFRGGGWNDTAWFCRSASRNWRGPSFRSSDVGFRLALSPSGGSPEAQ